MTEDAAWWHMPEEAIGTGKVRSLGMTRRVEGRTRTAEFDPTRTSRNVRFGACLYPTEPAQNKILTFVEAFLPTCDKRVALCCPFLGEPNARHCVLSKRALCGS